MKKFKKIYVEITNVCNMKCSFCPKTKRTPMFLSIDDFSYIIEKIRPFTDYIYIHIMGEPLMHSNICEIFDVCEYYGIKVNMTTNGTLICLKGDDILNKKSLRQINFSLHSFEANELNYSYEKYILDILDFINKTDIRGKIINCLRLWNIDSEINTKNVLIINIIKKYFNVNFDIHDIITDRNGIKIKDRVFLQQDRIFFWPNINSNLNLCYGKCFALKSHIGILSDGTIVPCCLDSEGIINLGNIFKCDLYDVLNEQRALNMKNGFSKNKRVEKLCKTCGWNFETKLIKNSPTSDVII